MSKIYLFITHAPCIFHAYLSQRDKKKGMVEKIIWVRTVRRTFDRD